MTPNALLAIIVVSVAAIFVAMIRCAPRNNECDNHHFEEHRRTTDFRVEFLPENMVGGKWWTVEQRVKYRCAHEGCSETKAEWDKIATTDADIGAIQAIKDNAE